MAAWVIDRNKIMTADEVQTVLDDLRRRAKRSPNTKLNQIIFLLATVCGLRASEIANLRICDLNFYHKNLPWIRVFNGKGGKTADVTIPDTSTAILLENHYTSMKDIGASGKDNFLQKLSGKTFDRHEVAKRFKSAIRCLPDDRIDALSVHSGRHTAATILLDEGETLATIRDFMRHSNVSTTSVYLHGRQIIPKQIYNSDEPHSWGSEPPNSWGGRPPRKFE